MPTFLAIARGSIPETDLLIRDLISDFSKLRAIIPASIFDRSSRELTKSIKRLLSSAMTVRTVLLFSLYSSPMPFSKRLVPSLMEARGVRSSWAINEKKSDFIFSISLSLLHIRLKSCARPPISGGEERSKLPSKSPRATCLVFFLMKERGLVMLLVMKMEIMIPERIKPAPITVAILFAFAPDSPRCLIFFVPILKIGLLLLYKFHFLIEQRVIAFMVILYPV